MLKSVNPSTLCTFRSPPGFAFVTYKNPEDADKAVRHHHGRLVLKQVVNFTHLTFSFFYFHRSAQRLAFAVYKYAEDAEKAVKESSGRLVPRNVFSLF